MASLKLCLQTVTGPKKQIRRSRIDSLADFSFTALLNVVADTFPGLPSTIELGYEDDEGELITLASDSDVQECVSVMDVAGKKTLRIEIICNEISTAAAGLDIDTTATTGVIDGPLSSTSASSSIIRDISPLGALSCCKFCGEGTANTHGFCSEECSTTAATFNSTFMSPTHDALPSQRTAGPMPVSGTSLQSSVLDVLHECDDGDVLGGDMVNLTLSFPPRHGISSYHTGPTFTPGIGLVYGADSNPALTRKSAASNASSVTAGRAVESDTPPPVCDDYTHSPPVQSFSAAVTPVPIDASVPLHEPSVCIPWVSPEVGRDTVIATFAQFGEVKQVDLVPREDHFLCFVHFDRWRVEETAVNVLRNRLLNPPSADFKESVEYMHPLTGQQRWLFSRSRVPPKAPVTKASSVISESSNSNPYGLGVVGINVAPSVGRVGASRVPTAPPPPTSAAFVPAHEPSLCVPWVRQNVTRELLQDTFAPYGSVKQVDLVPKGDHFLCFIHFHSWKLDDPVACAVRARLLNPPAPDHKETIYYLHPTLGRQRWLFARSWVAPQAPPSAVAPPAIGRGYSGGKQGPESAFTTSSSNRFSTGGLFSHSMGPGPSYPTRMPSGGSSGPILCLPDGYKPGPQFFEEENPSALSSGPYGYPPSGRASMYSRVIPSGHQSYPPQHHDSSVMKADWSTARMPPPFGHYQ